MKEQPFFAARCYVELLIAICNQNLLIFS